MNKTRSSTKIAIGFVFVAAAAYFGYGFVSGWMINRKHFDPIAPGSVNIVGVDTSAGYYVIVANQVAQLVRGQMGEFKPGEHDESEVEGEKKRVPIRDMLASLQGDEKALSKFVMVMNDMSDADFPPYPIIWKAEDVQKALDGDATLADKLEKDLNVKLDGTPVEQIRPSTLEGGIILDSPVPMDVQVGAASKRLTARVQEQFIPKLCSTVWNLVREKPNLTNAMLAGYYTEEGRRVLQNPDERQDVKQALMGRLDPDRLAGLASVPTRVLKSAQVIVSDSLIEDAEAREYKTSDGKPMNDLVLHLTDEGRQRLWQYSKRNPRSQLLVTWEGVAIAAPRIQGELALSVVTIKQLSDPDLVKETVDAIQKLNKEKT